MSIKERFTYWNLTKKVRNFKFQTREDGFNQETVKKCILLTESMYDYIDEAKEAMETEEGRKLVSEVVWTLRDFHSFALNSNDVTADDFRKLTVILFAFGFRSTNKRAV